VIEQFQQGIKAENRKFFVQAVIVLAVVLGIGIAIGRFWL
jgi:hypothetical protein